MGKRVVRAVYETYSVSTRLKKTGSFLQGKPLQRARKRGCGVPEGMIWVRTARPDKVRMESDSTTKDEFDKIVWAVILKSGPPGCSRRYV